MENKSDCYTPVDVKYNQVKQGPVFWFAKGQRIPEEIAHQMKAIWVGYAEYPEF